MVTTINRVETVGELLDVIRNRQAYLEDAESKAFETLGRAYMYETDDIRSAKQEIENIRKEQSELVNTVRSVKRWAGLDHEP